MEQIEHVEGDDTVKWLYKDVEVVSGTYTNNVRTYTSKSGLVYTLVDEKKMMGRWKW